MQMELTLSAAGSRDRASLGPQPGSAEAVQMTVTSGRRCSALLKLSGQGGSLVRMCEILFQWPWASSAAFLTWKISAMPSKRFYWALSVSMPRTDVIDAGLWPTLHGAGNPKGGPGELGMAVRHRQEPGGHVRLSGPKKNMWPTPSAHKITQSGEIVDAQGSTWTGRGKPHSKNTGAPIQTALTDAVKMWPTPHANASTGPGRQGREGGDNIQTAIGGSLNPTWVCWLMGYPLDWLDGLESPKASRESRRVSKTVSQNSGRSEIASSRKFPRSSAAVSSKRRG